MKTTVTTTAILQLLCVFVFFSSFGKLHVPILISSLTLVFLVASIGLLRRQNWARLLTQLLGLGLLIGGGIVCVVGIAGLSRGGIEIVGYAIIPTSVGFWWFRTFRSPESEQYFLPNVVVDHSVVANTSSRPTSISIIAVLMMLSLLTIPMYLMGPIGSVFPLMGMVIEGPWCRLIWVVESLAYVVMGYGLWRMKEWARVGAIAFQGLTMVNWAVLQLNPDAYYQYMAAIGQTKIQAGSIGLSLALAVLFGGVTFYFLIARRAAFRKTTT